MMYLPAPIAELTAGKPAAPNRIGFSASTVIEYEDMVLKIESPSDAVQNAACMMRALADKLPVPALLCDVTEAGKRYLLMRRIPGKMSCDPVHMRRPAQTVDLLAEGLQTLWRTDIADCPCRQDLHRTLADARRRIECGQYDPDTASPGTFGPGGFADPPALLRWLERNRPDEQPVLSHGDYCMPNIFFADRPDGTAALSGFIDLGAAGIADRWRDIAICCRSLTRNFAGEYGGPAYPGLDLDRFFDALGVERDDERMQYYLLLEELYA